MLCLRKRGGQPGNDNALRHGRYSFRKRAERRAKVLAKAEIRRRQEAERAASVPPTDYGAICDAIGAEKARRAGALH